MRMVQKLPGWPWSKLCFGFLLCGGVSLPSCWWDFCIWLCCSLSCYICLRVLRDAIWFLSVVLLRGLCAPLCWECLRVLRSERFVAMAPMDLVEVDVPPLVACAMFLMCWFLTYMDPAEVVLDLYFIFDVLVCFWRCPVFFIYMFQKTTNKPEETHVCQISESMSVFASAV